MEEYGHHLLKAKSKKGEEVVIDQQQPEFATHVNMRIVGGAPVLDFYFLDIRPLGHVEENDLEFDLEEGLLEPLVSVALAPSALDQLVETLSEMHECGPECEH